MHRVRKHSTVEGMFLLVSWMVLFGIFISCAEEEEVLPPGHPIIEENSPIVVIEVHRLISIQKRRLLEDGFQAVITINTLEGEPTAYRSQRIGVFLEDGIYRTEPLDLPYGEYVVAAFYILEGDGKIVEATPYADSAMGDEVETPLPLSFQVIHSQSGEPTLVSISAIPTSGFKPEDFGMHTFLISIIESVTFYIAVVTDLNIMDFRPAKLLIQLGDEEFTHFIEPEINLVESLPIQDNYHIRIQTQGYGDLNLTLSFDSLVSFQRQPLILVPGEDVFECVGGEYPCNLVLSSQSDVDSFSKRCATSIYGSLVIIGEKGENPVVNLEPLAGITSVGGDLVISQNPQLQSLSGLRSIDEIGGSIRISGNPRLRDLMDFPGINAVNGPLYIEENELLTSLEGLEQIEAAGMIFIQFNPSLRSLEGLGNLREAQQLSISSIPLLLDLKELYSLHRLGSLEVQGLKALKGLFGEGNGLNQLHNLELMHLPSLKNVEGLFKENGQVIGSIEIFNTGLENLDGLAIGDKLGFNLYLEGNAYLVDLSALVTLEEVARNLVISDNLILRNLNGLENLLSVGNGYGEDRGYRLQITDNFSLSDFCGIQNLLENGFYHRLNISGNQYDLPVEDIKMGLCRR
ncbi:receptor L domain-containing protein [Pleomorphovibrio marinus]|uniref:hypothetical protein n=1 Tax=Pleomorphovibrio marinus TaxID=2164132 RepID=UPI000E0A3206|nr:hypothetical protein [Pleomorphovibrio marinus]